MLPIDAILGLLLLLVIIIQSVCFMVPLGNENSTVRRLPWCCKSLEHLAHRIRDGNGAHRLYFDWKNK